MMKMIVVIMFKINFYFNTNNKGGGVRWISKCFLERGAEHECLGMCQLGGSEKFLKIESLQWLEMQ